MWTCEACAHGCVRAWKKFWDSFSNAFLCSSPIHRAHQHQTCNRSNALSISFHTFRLSFSTNIKRARWQKDESIKKESLYLERALLGRRWLHNEVENNETDWASWLESFLVHIERTLYRESSISAWMKIIFIFCCWLTLKEDGEEQTEGRRNLWDAMRASWDPL